jgi:translation initiation factor IF-2
MSRSSDGVRVIRDNIVAYDGKMSTLKRFKEDVKEVQTGYECGIMIENFNDLKIGDILENYIIEKIAGKL